MKQPTASITQDQLIEEAARRRASMGDQFPEHILSGGFYFLPAILGRAGGRINKVPSDLLGLPVPARPEFACRDFDKVHAFVHRHPLAFAVGLVLDHRLGVLDFDNGKGSNGWHWWMLKIIRESGSFAEYSSSMQGSHLFLKLRNPVMKRGKRFVHGQGVEVLTQTGYVAMTGNKFHGSGDDVLFGDELLAEVEREIASKSDRKMLSRNGYAATVAEIVYRGKKSAPFTDEKILAKCRASKNRDKFIALYYYANISEYDYDRSRGDLALVCILAFYTQDPVQLERLWLGSALADRDKTRDREDYRVITITNALNNHGAVE